MQTIGRANAILLGLGVILPAGLQHSLQAESYSLKLTIASRWSLPNACTDMAVVFDLARRDCIPVSCSEGVLLYYNIQLNLKV
jgi:hypothetical protein